MVVRYYLPLYFQAVHLVTPLRSGVLILPITVSEASIGILTGVLIHRYGRYTELTHTGTFLLTLGTALYTILSRTSTLAQIVPFELIGGMGAGFLFESPLIAVQAHVSQADTASATATFAFVRSVAMAAAIVIGGVIFQNSMHARVPALRAAGLDASLLEKFSYGDAAANVYAISDIRDLRLQHAVQAAYAGSLRNIWIVFAVVSGIGFIGGLFMRHRELETEHTETRTGVEEMTKRERSTG